MMTDAELDELVARLEPKIKAAVRRQLETSLADVLAHLGHELKQFSLIGDAK